MMNAVVEFILHLFFVVALLGVGVCAVNIFYYACVLPFSQLIDSLKTHFQNRKQKQNPPPKARD